MLCLKCYQNCVKANPVVIQRARLFSFMFFISYFNFFFIEIILQSFTLQIKTQEKKKLVLFGEIPVLEDIVIKFTVFFFFLPNFFLFFIMNSRYSSSRSRSSAKHKEYSRSKSYSRRLFLLIELYCFLQN